LKRTASWHSKDWHASYIRVKHVRTLLIYDNLGFRSVFYFTIGTRRGRGTARAKTGSLKGVLHATVAAFSRGRKKTTRSMGKELRSLYWLSIFGRGIECPFGCPFLPKPLKSNMSLKNFLL